ncbi:hypothetical protein MAHJHV35_46760 [Mycobacterium avium subsp. hominissuis]
MSPAFQLLTYPMLDDRGSDTAPSPNYRLWDNRSNRFGRAGTATCGSASPR